MRFQPPNRRLCKIALAVMASVPLAFLGVMAAYIGKLLPNEGETFIKQVDHMISSHILAPGLINISLPVVFKVGCLNNRIVIGRYTCGNA